MTDLIVPTTIEGEARIRDLDLAARLGFADPHKIRPLIERYKDALAALGVSATVAETSGTKGGRPGKAYYLNRKQAIFITAKSETAEATDITIEIIDKFDAYENGLVSSKMTELNERRVRLREWNEANRTIDRIIRTAGSRAAQANLKKIYAKVGLDLSIPGSPDQGELGLPEGRK